MSQDAGQGQQFGQQTGQPANTEPPDWYKNPPAWMRPPPAQPPYNSGNTGNNDLVTAVNAMPERVVAAMRDAITAATQQQPPAQQPPAQQPPAQQPEQQPAPTPGKRSFAEWWFSES